MKTRLGFVSNSSSSSYLVVSENTYDFERLVYSYPAMDGPNKIVAVGKDAVTTFLEEWDLDNVENVIGLVKSFDEKYTVYLVFISRNDPGLFDAMRVLHQNNILAYWYLGE